nr:hsk1-interacting molecule 1 [Quercus suber]
MATVSLLQTEESESVMAGKRVPLVNVPNAINSPYRQVGALNGKRTRAQTGEALYGQPPAKKHVVEASENENGENVDPRKRSGVPIGPQLRLDESFSKQSINRQPTAFDKLLVSARERRAPSQVQHRVERTEKGAERDNLESVRQWQRHYRRQFPQFVIYFESVPDDARSKVVHQIRSLGAREEMFFSKAVTHVVTTRDIPPAMQQNINPDDEKPDQKIDQALAITVAQAQRRPDVDSKRVHGASDILTRARELGIKIWALEKLHRILRTMLETHAESHGTVHATRSHAATTKSVTKPSNNADLEQLLRNEKINGPADRDMTVAAQDMCTFRGHYIYVHDMDEKTRPVMVRDYPKPATKEQGKWPQFRLSAEGRCPFVEDSSYARKLQQREREAQGNKTQGEPKPVQRRTRAVGSHETEVPRALTECPPNLRRSPRKQGSIDLAKPLDPPKVLPSQRNDSTETFPPMFGSAQLSLRKLPRTVGGEPVASGIQKSNITSAIRSQAISSAAISSTAPGAARRIDSKEVTALKRKVLERGASITSNHSMPSSYMNDMRVALNNDEPPPRAAKRKAQETLGVLHEDDESTRDIRGPKHRRPAPKSRKPASKDPKPGYCENCHDKFEDFDEVCEQNNIVITYTDTLQHCQSRKHRKFALTQDNWKELDDLLSQLKRPHKGVRKNPMHENLVMIKI